MRYVSSITCSLIPLHLFHPPVRAWFDAVSPAPTRPPQFGWPARALAETGGDDSALLPHLKARAGETQPAVTGQERSRASFPRLVLSQDSMSTSTASDRREPPSARRSLR